MRDDGLWLDADDAEFFASALALLDALLRRRGHASPPEVAQVRRKLDEFLAGRVESRADVTTRPSADWLTDADLVDSTEAAEQLGLTVGAVRKACRAGRFMFVAQKQRGRWMIPAADVERSA